MHIELSKEQVRYLIEVLNEKSKALNKSSKEDESGDYDCMPIIKVQSILDTLKYQIKYSEKL